MNRLKVNFTFCEVIQMFMVFIVYGWFFYFSWISYSEFQNEMTGMSQFITPANDLPLPTITVCSKEIFKNVSDETNQKMLLQNLNNYVFTFNDLFHQKFLKNKHWKSHEIFSAKLGLCFSLRANQNINSTNYYLFFLLLPTGQSYQVGLCTYMPP